MFEVSAINNPCVCSCLCSCFSSLLLGFCSPCCWWVPIPLVGFPLQFPPPGFSSSEVLELVLEFIQTERVVLDSRLFDFLIFGVYYINTSKYFFLKYRVYLLIETEKGSGCNF